MDLQQSAMEKLLFRQELEKVTLIYNMYQEYLGKEKYRAEISQERNKIEIPNTFRIVAAFGCFLYPELKLVTGRVSFISGRDYRAASSTIAFVPHHWLMWRDENHIIDVIPVDGGFELSSPQAVIQRNNRRRFFPSTSIYPDNWDRKARASFNNGVNKITETLELLTEDMPLFG